MTRVPRRNGSGRPGRVFAAVCCALLFLGCAEKSETPVPEERQESAERELDTLPLPEKQPQEKRVWEQAVVFEVQLDPWSDVSRASQKVLDRLARWFAVKLRPTPIVDAEEMDIAPSSAELRAIRERLRLSVVSPDTVLVDSSDVEILGLLTSDLVSHFIDPRYRLRRIPVGRIVTMRPGEEQWTLSHAMSQGETALGIQLKNHGVSEFRIRQEGSDRLWVIVEKEDADKARQALHYAADSRPFAFHIIDDDRELFQQLRPAVEAYVARHPEFGKGVALEEHNGLIRLWATHPSQVADLQRELLLAKALPGDLRLTYESLPSVTPKGEATRRLLVHTIWSEVGVSGRNVVRGSVEKDENSLLGINIDFDSVGREVLHRLTREHVGEGLAIVWGNEVLAAPIIREAISGGQARLFLGTPDSDSEARAEALAKQLVQGSIPVPMRLIAQRSVEGTQAIEALFAQQDDPADSPCRRMDEFEKVLRGSGWKGGAFCSRSGALGILVDVDPALSIEDGKRQLLELAGRAGMKGVNVHSLLMFWNEGNIARIADRSRSAFAAEILSQWAAQSELFMNELLEETVRFGVEWRFFIRLATEE